jgi:SAM-dependent methyltransferase
MTRDLRSRLYGRYVSGGQARAPDTPAGLASREPYLKRLIQRHFPPDRSAAVFEIGCGYGALVHFAREAGYRDARGVDTATEQVTAAAGLGIQGIVQGDLLETLSGLAPDSLDVVIAFDVLEHFGKDEILALVDSVHRVLRVGGRWILHAPNAESPFFGAILYGDLTHELAFTRRSLSQLLCTSGFEQVRCFEDDVVVHGAKSRVRALLWKLIRAALRVYIAAETGDAGRDAILTRNLLAVAVK